MKIFIIYFIVFIVSAFIVTGWFFADLDSGSENKKESRFCLKLGVLSGIVFGVLGPIGILLSFYLTGCAENGWKIKVT